MAPFIYDRLPKVGDYIEVERKSRYYARFGTVIAHEHNSNERVVWNPDDYHTKTQGFYIHCPASPGKGWRYANHQPSNPHSDWIDGKVQLPLIGQKILYTKGDEARKGVVRDIQHPYAVVQYVGQGKTISPYYDGYSGFKNFLGDNERRYWKPDTQPAVSNSQVQTNQGEEVFIASYAKAKGGARAQVLNRDTSEIIWESDVVTDEKDDDGRTTKSADSVANELARNVINTMAANLFANVDGSGTAKTKK